MRRLWNIVVILVAVALLYGMWVTKPRYGELTGPIVSYGKMHDLVHTREFEVKLNQVTFARELAYTQFGKEKVLTTSGLWVVAAVELAATTKSTGVSSAIWQGPTGLRFEQSNRVGWLAGQPPFMLEPGLPKRVQLAFEIMPDQVNGATLLVSAQLDPSLDSEARIAVDDFKKFNDGQPLIVDRFDISRPQPAAGS
ncbi:hypothetical protein [Phyllobacterium sp. YR531]|uniref:hypothetical protein n=1 Tax=Phyllobacterium sp. YR531 TaxID=1144343 RepID=UPI00026F7501|nr:hypothetical protein [Phyllobacterium sp. YR531]EJN05167.1 hypothetical protein PMI41_00949 [Phyllobacterium sp. YR531]